MICKFCNTEMIETNVKGVWMCVTGHALEGEKWWGCDCGFCESRSHPYRRRALIAECLRWVHPEIFDPWFGGKPGESYVI